jgi:hypothetical protein
LPLISLELQNGHMEEVFLGFILNMGTPLSKHSSSIAFGCCF